MNIVQVKNNQVVKYTLPKVGILNDGSTVSGYDTLMLSNPDLAKEEGWIPLEDIKPIYNEETQYLLDNGYEILSDKVIKKYKIENIQEPEIVDEYVDEEKISMAEAIIDLESRLAELEKLQGGNI
ncbi:hypothetical protein EV204_105191 [Tissierella praeacuta]|uniref:hypothetical protein n=1 Tax=Tissierella praeacuta TaxID=43131 RepID=UPI001046BFA9|nr:hypothetical protein [Tissierella praeacuta]TCU72855.1 hypothetical protein EV204_105191 [Tissierella praeacuta]